MPTWQTHSSIPVALGRYGLYLAAFFLIYLSYWMNRYFGVPELDQIMYHLDFGVDGLIMSDPVLQRRFFRWCVIAPLLTLTLAIVAERIDWARRSRRVARLCAAWPGASIALLRHLPWVLLLGGTLHWLIQISALNHVAASFGADYFAAHYIASEHVAVRARQPKNLILIYVESLESGYRDQQAFGADLLAPLDSPDGASFASFQQAPGTGWTIAGLVATQCGVPLKRVTLFDENTQGRALRSFLPNATCLSDILARHGYRNVFMGGASTQFAGKGKFLREHAYHEVYGKEDWMADGVNEDAMNGWGLFDDDLFARARVKLHALAARKQPFNLTLLTVNTHEPNGHLSSSCRRRGYRGFGGVVQCTARDLADFIGFVRASGYLDNTNIVVIGDHLARKNPLFARLESMPARNVFNLFISAEQPLRNTDRILHFDLLPTILEFSGFDVAGGRLGLGYSAFYAHADHAPAQRFGEMQQALMNRSDTYLALWSPAPTPTPTPLPVLPAQ